LPTEPKVQARPRRWMVPITLVLLEEEFGFEQINPGSVYRTLRQMENEGLCSSEWDVRAESGPPRRMYAVTEEGKAYLSAWAKACKQYQNLMDEFARIYGSRSARSSD
jgi:PadR family transcriptional regulator